MKAHRMQLLVLESDLMREPNVEGVFHIFFDCIGYYCYGTWY